MSLTISIFRIFGCDSMTILQLTEKPIFQILSLKVCISVCHPQVPDRSIDYTVFYDLRYAHLRALKHM